MKHNREKLSNQKWKNSIFFFFQQFLNLQISISKLYSNLVRSKFQTIKIISRIHYTTPMSWSQPVKPRFSTTLWNYRTFHRIRLIGRKIENFYRVFPNAFARAVNPLFLNSGYTNPYSKDPANIVQPTARNLFIVSRQQANTSAFYWAGMKLA